MTLLLLTVLLVSAAGDTPSDEALARAVELFRMADGAVQEQILGAVVRRVEEAGDAGLKRLLKLRERARREAKPRPAAATEFFDHAEYAPVQAARHFLPADDPETESQIQLMRPWENATEYSAAVRYDYATNRIVALAETPDAAARLQDHLYGYPPDTDLLVAWLESQFDPKDAGLDQLAGFFGHAYCDRNGNCFPGITIYDAFASQSNVEMPDVDCIAYARLLLKDKSYVSPIPADRRRQQLYDAMGEGFLEHFRNRTFIEAMANVYVNPEAIVRADHEGLRERILVAVAADGEDVAKLASRLKKAKDRDQFIEQTDALTAKDKRLLAGGYRWREERNQTRWAVAQAAYAALREHGLLAE